MNKRKLHPYEVDWNVALQRLDTQAEFLNHDEMAKIINELREILGEGFLIRAFHSGFALAQSFKFILTWHEYEVREFYALLKECAHFKNYNEVLAKIRQGKRLPQIREGLTQLRTAYFFRHDFHVTFESNLTEINKKPDLLLHEKATGKPLYVEISELFDSDESLKISNQMDQLFTDFFLRNQKGIMVSGQLESVLDDEEVNVFRGVLERNLIEVADREGIYSHQVPGKFTIVAYKPSHEKEAKRFARENKFDISGISGPSQWSDFRRLRGKIKIKAEQLSPKYDNIIVIWSDTLLVPAIIQGQPGVENTEELLKAAPHVAGVIIAHACSEMSLPLSNHEGILQCVSDGMLYSLMPIFRKGKEELKQTVCSAFMKNGRADHGPHI